MTEASDRLRLLFDWASAQDARRRLALWLIVALLLHSAAWLVFRISYPPPEPIRFSDATLYVLLPGSAEEKRLAPFLAAADPALFAPEDAHGRELIAPPLPAYEPSFTVAKPQLLPLADSQPRVLPPLIRDFGPVPVSEAEPVALLSSAPTEETAVVFSGSLVARPVTEWPKRKFTVRPRDELEASRFLIAVAPDGRVLHVVKDGPTGVLDDAASIYLMHLRFARGPDSSTAWGMATFHWGLDVKREELP
jgi:hypothetical protein